METITIYLIIFAMIFMFLGGLLDMTDAKLCTSKEHLWHDGTFILVLASLYEFSQHK